MSSSPYAALQFKDFRLLLAARFAAAFGSQMLSFAVAWDVWIRTQSPFSLGLIGLVLVLPVIVLALPAGVAADRRNRRHIVLAAQSVSTLGAAALALIAFFQAPVALVFVCLAVLGTARAFNDPAASTLVPLVVPPEHFTNAATWNSSVFQIASIAGPAFAGLLVGLWGHVTGIYALGAILFLGQVILVSFIKSRPAVVLAPKGASWESLKEGLRFIFSKKVVLSAITLDLFAVLFGGAVALLPIYATDVLHVGAWGLGILRAAASIGALSMAVFLAHRPPFKNAGRTLLICVAGFGFATIVFGLSPWFPLSVAMLVLLGAMDNVSVVVRSTLMMTQVPDEMRGRISAVNTIFISSSNELGDFESGLVAGFVGPVAAVVAGGIGTLVVVTAVAKGFPELRNLKTLDQKT